MNKIIKTILFSLIPGTLIPIFIIIVNNLRPFLDKLSPTLLLAIIALEFIIICILSGLLISINNNIKEKLSTKFGIYWNKQFEPFCPIHKTPLMVIDDTRYRCIQCKTNYPLKGENGISYTLESVKLHLQKKGDLIQKKVIEDEVIVSTGIIKDEDRFIP